MKRPLSPDDLEAWRAYEAANRASAEQYKALPVAHWNVGEGLPCTRCHRRSTRAKSGVCPTCVREAT